MCELVSQCVCLYDNVTDVENGGQDGVEAELLVAGYAEVRERG